MTPEQLKRLQIIANDLGSEAKTSLPNTINGITLDGPTAPSSIGNVGVSSNKTSVAFNKDVYDKYKKYGVILNPGNSEEELNRERAENQTRLEQFGRSLGRMIWSEAVLGTLRGFGDIYDAVTTRNLFKPEYEKSDYTNPYSEFFENAQNAANERMAIYRENPNVAWDLGDFAWWADNAVSVASTLSLMIPSKAITGGIGLIGKTAKYAASAGKLAKARKANNFTDVLRGIGRSNHIWDKPLRGALGANRYKKLSDAIDIGASALISRMGENYIEARDVYNMTLEDTKAALRNFTPSQRAEFFKNNPDFEGKSDDEIAKYIAGESAGRTYRDDFAMLLMDIAQFKSISAAWKNMPNRAAGLGLANANRKAFLNATIAENVENAGEEAAKKLGKGIFSAERRAALKDAFKGVKVWNSIEALELGEGVEEMYQYIASQKGEEIAKHYLNPNYTDKDLLSYFSDGELWEQGLWGILGGLAFQGAGKGLNKLSAKLQASLNKDLSEEQINDLLKGDNARRYAEIEGRKAKVDKFIDDLILIQQGKNPFEKREDRFEDIETADDKERLTNMLMGQLAEELTFNAIENGNYDLFKTWIDNSAVNEYISQKAKESGIELSTDVETKLKDDMDKVAEAYNQNYYDILDNADVTNPYALRAAARHLTRQQRTIDDINLDIQRKQSTLNKMDDINDETQNDIYIQAYNHALLEIDRLRARAEGLTQLYKSGKPNQKGDILSKDGYDANLKEINAIRRGIATFLINNTPFGENTRAKALFDEGKYQEVLDVFEDNNEFTDVTSKYKEQTSGLINDIAAEELHKGVLEEVIPKSKDELSGLYDDFESAMYKFADTRFNDAYDIALDYIRKSKDYDKALSDLLTDNISDRKVKDAMKMLKVGYSNRKALSRDFMKDINKLKNKDTAEAKKVSSEEINGETVELQNTAAEETQTSVNTNVSETSAITNNTVNQATPPIRENPAEEVANLGGDVEVEPEPTADEEKFIANEAKMVLQRFTQIKTNDSEQARIDAGVAAHEVCKEHPMLLERVLDGKSQDFDLDYSNLLNAIAAKLVQSYNMDPILANSLSQYGLQLYLNNSYTRRAFGNKQDELKNIDKLLRYIDEINTNVDWSAGWNTIEGIYDPSKIRSLSSDEYYDRFIQLMRTYKELRENLYEKDGKTYVNLYDIAQFVLNLAEEEKLNFESATQFITNLRYFAKTYNGNEFVLEGTSFINKYTDSIIDDLFERFTSYEPIGDVMHFDAFRTKNYANPTKQKPLITKFKEFRSKNKQLFVQYRYKTNSDERISIDLYYLDDNGGKQEIGYLDVVDDISKGKQNSAYKRTKGIGFRFGVSLQGTSYEMTPAIDKLFKEIIAGSNPNATEQQKRFYNIFKNYFALNNSKEFNTVKYSNEYKINPNDVLEFLNSDLFLDLLENGDYGIQYSKGEKYSKYLGKNIEVYDFHTKESFSKLTNEEKQNISSKFFNDLSNILFYQLKAYVPKGQQRSELTEADMLASYNEFVKKTFENYKATYTIQKQLDEFEKGNADNTVGLAINYVSDNASTLNYEENGNERNISELNIISHIKNHPYVYVDGTTMYDETGKAYKTPRWMLNGTSGILMYDKNGTPFIAMFTGTNEVNDGNEKLRNSLREHFAKYIDEYFNASGKDIERAYNNLYNMFVSLIGRQALFSGFDIVKLPSSEAFAIRVNDEITGKPRNLITFFKYNADLIWKNNHWENKEGQRVNGDDKNAYLAHSMKFNINGQEKAVYGNTTNEAKKEISIAINSLFYGNYAPVKGVRTRRFRGLQFNSSAIVSKYNKGRTEKGVSSILTKRNGKINDYMSMKNGKLVVKIGSFEETYENYAHFLVANNAMKTTHSGKTERTVDEYNTAPTSVYVDISSVKTPVKESNKELRKGLSSYVKNNAVDGKMQMSATDVLLASDVQIDEVNKFKQANDKIEQEEGMGFLPDTVEIDTAYQTNDDGGYFSLYDDNPYAGKIVLFRNGVKLLNNKGRIEAIRLLVHEQIHKVTEVKHFFTGDIGKQRVDAINDLWNQFYKHTRTLDKNDSIRKFANEFNRAWKSEGAETIAKEFISEVMSQKHLMEVLDTIPYKGKYNIEGTTEGSLLQKLLKILADLFNGLQNLTKNSILDNIYTLLGDNPSITITTKNKQAKKVKEIDTVSEEIEETNNTEPIVEKPTDTGAGEGIVKNDTKEVKDNPEEQEETNDENEDDEDDEPRPMLGTDDYNASKIRSALPVEVRIEDINEDSINNPYGLMFIPNMESYLERFSPSDRAAMVSELTAGRINYVCQ